MCNDLPWLALIRENGVPGLGCSTICVVRHLARRQAFSGACRCDRSSANVSAITTDDIHRHGHMIVRHHHGISLSIMDRIHFNGMPLSDALLIRPGYSGIFHHDPRISPGRSSFNSRAYLGQRCDSKIWRA